MCAGSWPLFDARPPAGTFACTVAPLPMSGAIVVQRLPGSWHSGRRGDGPAAEHPDGLSLRAELLDRVGKRLLFGCSLDVEEELVAAEAAPKRPRLDPGQVDLAAGEDLQCIDQRTGMVLTQLREDQRRTPWPGPRRAGPLPSHPDEASDVVGLVLDAAPQHGRAIETRRGFG